MSEDGIETDPLYGGTVNNEWIGIVSTATLYPIGEYDPPLWILSLHVPLDEKAMEWGTRKVILTQESAEKLIDLLQSEILQA